jgi:hypothetical protein
VQLNTILYSGALHLSKITMINFTINITPRCGLAFGFMMQQITGAAHRNIVIKASSSQTSGFSDESGNLIIKEKP